MCALESLFSYVCMKWSGFMNSSSLQLQHYKFTVYIQTAEDDVSNIVKDLTDGISLPYFRITLDLKCLTSCQIRLDLNEIIINFTSLLKSINTWFKTFYRQIILCSKVLLGRSFLWLCFFQLQLEILDSSSRPNLVRCFDNVWYGFKIVFVWTL